MTVYAGPYGFRFYHQRSGTLCDDEEAVRVSGRRDGWLEFPELPDGLPKPLPLPFVLTMDGRPYWAQPRFPDAYRQEDLIEAGFTVLSEEAQADE